MLPHELCQIDRRQLVKLLQVHRKRLLPFYGSEGVEGISEDFSEFLHAFREEPQFKEAVLKERSRLLDFNTSWFPTQGRFPSLQQFCGGLASAFPNTATVELDFSLIRWEKNDFRSNLADFTLEGILHCKQLTDLKKLSRGVSNVSSRLS